MRDASMILVDGKARPRHNALGDPIAQTDDSLVRFWRWFGDSRVVDAQGRPLVVYHGTAARFEAFSVTAHRTVLNSKYQGDGFHFSPDRRVAEKYSEANRNQSFNKARMYAALERAVPKEIADLFKTVVEQGYNHAWDISDEDIRALMSIADGAGIDLNNLLDLAEHVEGSRWNAGRRATGQNNLMLLFSGGGIYLPDWARESAERFGLGDAVPRPRVISVYLSANEVLVTDDRYAARAARNSGFNGVLYGGEDTVSNVPEWTVFQPEQIKSVDNIGLWSAHDPRIRDAGESDMCELEDDRCAMRP